MALRMDLSRMAMNCHPCSFLEDCDLRPALRIACTTCSGSGLSWNLRIARFVRIASDTFIELPLKCHPERRISHKIRRLFGRKQRSLRVTGYFDYILTTQTFLLALQ